MAPPGTYIISNPAFSTFVGVTDDGTKITGYRTLDKAQLWEVHSDLRISTILVNGERKYIQATTDGAMDTSGRNWTFIYVSENTYKIALGPYNPDHCVLATNTGGTPQNAEVAYNYRQYAGTAASWWFIPFSGALRPVWNQAMIPKDLFAVSSANMLKIVGDMLAAFKGHLDVERSPSMIPTYVTRIPDGSEQGKFLSLTMADNLSISYFELDGASDTSVSQKRTFNFRAGLLGGPAKDLFEFIAKCVNDAITDDWHIPTTQDDPLLMGMTFAFPVSKTSLASGKLLRWTKEITQSVTAGGTVGQDVVVLLQKALDEVDGLHVKCNALINDTTATLLAQAYETGGCDIGAMFDIGTNGAYVETASNVKALALNGDGGQMVVNTEWGSFENCTNLQRTQFDYRIDRQSAYPGKQIFEKLVSASSIGELVRLVILHYIDTGIPPVATENRPLFSRVSSDKLNTRGSISLEFVWELDTAKTSSAAQQLIIKKLGIPQDSVTPEDGSTVKEICRAILLRTARLSACVIASILVLMGRAAVGGGVDQGGRVGINGSLTRSAAFRRDMEEALREIIGANATRNVLITQVKRDRTNLGAAVCACLAST